MLTVCLSLIETQSKMHYVIKCTLKLVLCSLAHLNWTKWTIGIILCLKGRISRSNPSCKDDNTRYTTVLFKQLCLIKNVEDIVVFLGLKVFNSDNFYTFSCNRNARVTFVKNPQWKIFMKNILISNSYLIRHSFEGARCKSGIADIFARRVT